MKNKPENLKLYFNEAKTQEIIVENNTVNNVVNSSFEKKGFLSLDDMEEVKHETIYWSWPLETGSNDEEIAANDILDSKWMNTVMTMGISAVGTQVTKDPLEIAVTDVDGNEILINRMNVKDYYGTAIEYKGNENDTNTYRLFYIDYENKYGDGEGAIYLKADYTTNNTCLTTHNSTSTSDLNVFQNMNQQWVIADGQVDCAKESKAA